MSWIDRVGEFLTRGQYRKFERVAINAETAQLKVFAECARSIRGGSFWAHKLSLPVGRLPTRVEDFPLTTYEDYRTAIETGFPGDHSPLNGERIQFWCTSSGTSGVRKFFPMTAAHYRQASRTALPQFNRLLREYPGFFGGKVLSLASPFTGELSPSGIPVGLLSTSFYYRAPAFLDFLLGIPSAVFRSELIFEEWGPVYAMAADLSSIIGMTPLGVCRVFHAMEAKWGTYRDLLVGHTSLPPGLPRLRISRRRRKELQTFFAEFPDAPPADKGFPVGKLWPKLRAVFCWKSSIAAGQLPELVNYLGPDVPILDGQYSATEAWFNVPLTRELGGPLHLGAHVFEFLPVAGESDARLLRKPWELEVGKEYEIVLSNAMGLIRYRIFDIVRCVGYFHKSPVITFESKAQDIIGLDAAVVRLPEVVSAFSKVGLLLDDTSALSASPNGENLILFKLELKNAAAVAPLGSRGFAETLDAALRRESPAYERTRAEGTTASLEVIRLLPGDPLASRIFPRLGSTGMRAQEKARAIYKICPLTSDEIQSLRGRIPDSR